MKKDDSNYVVTGTLPAVETLIEAVDALTTLVEDTLGAGHIDDTIPIRHLLRLAKKQLVDSEAKQEK